MKKTTSFIFVLFSLLNIDFVLFANSYIYVADVNSFDIPISNDYGFSQTSSDMGEYVRYDANLEYSTSFNMLQNSFSQLQENLSIASYNYDNAGYIPSSLLDLNSDVGGVQLFSIIGSDGRSRVNPTNVFPYSAICRITTNWPNGTVTNGTAWMYWEDIAITAGHCVYSSSRGGWATSISVVPARNSEAPTYPYGSTISTTFWTSSNYTNNENSDYDYAVLELNTNIGNLTGWFGTHSQSSSLTGTNITITGYPGDENLYYQMWGMSGTVSSTYTYTFRYAIDTSGGQSGSPIYRYNSSHGYQALGIHTHGATYFLGILTQNNFGTRITSNLFDFFSSFRV
jgi:glutamyl endopeptidase